MKHYFAIDVGGTKVAYGIFDEKRKLIARDKYAADTKSSPEDFCSDLARRLTDLADGANIALSDIFGAGLILPGYINYETGELPHVTNMPNLSHSFPGKLLSERLFGMPVLLENDCNGAGLGEARTGAGRGYDSMIYITVSTGIGGGIIINGRPFHGTYGAAAEVGHLLITPGEGALCGCGNRGCFESICSSVNMPYHLKKDYEAGIPTSLISRVEDIGKIDGRMLEEGARNGDPLALRHVDRMGRYLGILCYNLYQVLNINCYVFGGGMSNMGEFLIGRIRDSFLECNKNSVFPVYFLKSEHGGDVGLYGAIELFLEK